MKKRILAILKWIILVILSLNFLVSSAFFLLFWRAYNGPRPFEDIITEETVERITLKVLTTFHKSDEIPIDLDEKTNLVRNLKNIELSLPRMDFTLGYGGTHYLLTVYLKNGDKHTILFSPICPRGYLFDGKLVFSRPYGYVTLDGGKEYLMAQTSFNFIVNQLRPYADEFFASLETQTE